MAPLPLTQKDLEQLADKGISAEQVMGQIHLLRNGAPYARLNRPCTIGDGILNLTEPELKRHTVFYDQESPRRTIIKFVPASGAATRMFEELIQLELTDAFVEPDWIRAKAAKGDRASQTLLTVMRNLPHFAFYDELKKCSTHEEINIGRLQKREHYLRVLRYLLHPVGLDYARLPKGLLLFHRYPEGARTAFEEHLVEAALYAKGKDDTCRLHFTVASGYMARFEALFNHVRRHYESEFGMHLEVHFSTQKSSSDTVATDMNNKPFRLENGRILFRPGGHGALIDNLNRLDGDIIFIKNIDNVVPDGRKPATTRYKKALAGLLLSRQQETFQRLESLHGPSPSEQTLQEIAAFAGHHLGATPPPEITRASQETRRAWLFERLNRPLRVCGMVRNEGEPGGGPFWVEGDDLSVSLQIVENAAVNPSASQQKILKASTHFNPVDLVCATRDFKGKPFDLTRFVNPKSVFIARKSKGERKLNALELPGLWNGAMAHWNTLFVEVPKETFNPVKTITDLLRKEHLTARDAGAPCSHTAS
ncbi:hypothetical protein DSLASN_30210 [Desulfoluna limicola]|uniref:DUF4301 domain-containing protein n=1 Tax=Desulfoluna limicola TaxID=2810562 RepID=A0ABM7PIH3_9BACT|nr:DUF4301 family protein [Desulfoluna limicola]BCS97389.1 hypothetical protein DSLASN_30210 [Desulfoluna limicola]